MNQPAADTLVAAAGADAITEIIEGMEQRTHKRRLHGSREDQQAHETNSALWAKLYAAPHIEHRLGRSFQRPGCATCLGHLTVWVLADDGPGGANKQGQREVVCPACSGLCMTTSEYYGEAPDDHADGYCFECSGLDAPEGFSQAERQARAAAVAEMPRLRMVLR